MTIRALCFLVLICGSLLAGPVTSKLVAGDAGAGDKLGHAVDVDGDTAVLGAPFDDQEAGAAYVFHWDGTTWIQQAKLVAPDASAGDRFGSGVGISGDTVVVGSRWDDDYGEYSGSAYVFVRSGTAWTQQAKLTASDASAFDAFGARVDIDGETVVVGAVYGESGAGASGAAYVFVRSGTTWTEQAKLIAGDATQADEFGNGIAISGDTIVAGARLDDNSAGIDAGSAYVFQRNGTTWTEQAKLTASDAAAGDLFGVGVAVDGDIVVVGALYDDNAAGAVAGAAYVFHRSGGIWTEEAKLTASDAAAGDTLGVSAAIDGDTVVVGSILDDDAGSASGSAYVFGWTGTAWAEQAKLTACDAAAFDQFGYSAAVSGTRVVVGSYQDDHAGGNNAGSAYVLELAQENVPPVVDAGENRTILTQEQAGTVLAGSVTDANGGVIRCRWLKDGEVIAEGSCDLDLGTLAPLAIGDHTFVLEACDCVSTVADPVVVTVNNSPPLAAPTGGGTYELGPESTIELGGQVADFDGDELTWEWRSNGTVLSGPHTISPPAGGAPADLATVEITTDSLGLGVHSIELVVDDGVNVAVASEIEVEVTDATAPTMSLSASSSILWPPNHTMREVIVWAETSDNSGGEVTLSVEVSSDEPGDGDHDVVSVDQATGEIRLNLRAERQGKGDGRTYSITVTASDEAGNSSVAVIMVLAPHDRRN